VQPRVAATAQEVVGRVATQLGVNGRGGYPGRRSERFGGRGNT
jgi:hypothetical protein